MDVQKEKLPNSTGILVLGICSLVGIFCCSLGGIVCGIIALVLYPKAEALNAEDPDKYDGFQNCKTGRIMAIIGLILSIISMIVGIIMAASGGLEQYF